MKQIIYNGVVVNEGERFEGYVVLNGEMIEKVAKGELHKDEYPGARLLDAKGGYIMAGVIDDQVHFRDPGLTYKGDIESESRAAAAGGVTSFMDMPNTTPLTISMQEWEKKMERASEVSSVNYGFLVGATNDNLDVVRNLNPKHIPGVKVFMGSSTGGMLVDRRKTLEGIFAESPVLVATHCEDEGMIKEAMAKYGAGATAEQHPLIRSAEACYRSSALAVEIATKYNSRLHVLHLSTARELSLFESRPLSEKLITNEVCLHHLWFTDKEYAKKGNLIKWNPAIKSQKDRDGLREGLKNGRVDIVATDHAPHTLEEKQRPYSSAPSGGPMVQHSLVAMLELFSPEDTINYMAHRVAECFKIDRRGYLKEGYFADVIVVEKSEWEVTKANILYKCAWSPMEGVRFNHRVAHTFVNGSHVVVDGEVMKNRNTRSLEFNR